MSRLINMQIESCADCPFNRVESPERLRCAKDDRTVMIWKSVDEAREVMFKNCSLVMSHQCCFCFGSGKRFSQQRDDEILCDYCKGIGRIEQMP